MALTQYLDKGASLGPDEACLVMDDTTLSYAEVQKLSYRVARALAASGIGPGDKVAILSTNHATSFSCVFGIARAGAVWCPINPRNEAAENRDQLELFDCSCLIYLGDLEPLVAQILPDLPKVQVLVCIDGPTENAVGLGDWLAPHSDEPFEVAPADDVVMIVGTGGTTGRPKGVQLTGRNIETMTAITLMSYRFDGRPVYLAFAPLTHAAGVLCFPVLSHGGRIVIMHVTDPTALLRNIVEHRVTHTFLPPTVIYVLLSHPDVANTDFSTLQTFWYGAAPISPARLKEAIETFGPVMAQLFGQSEAPMMISTMSPSDHLRPDGSVWEERLASAGRPSPLVTVAIMDSAGKLLPRGERGEIVVRSSLVMPGYYRNPEATAEVGAHGWHHTGDIGYLDDDNFLFIVDRAKDMIITGGFNVYSAEVENALMAHPDIHEAAVIGLPDEKWGERVVAVVQPVAGHEVDTAAVAAFVKAAIGSVKTPKQFEVWDDLPRSKVGKVVKPEIRAKLATP